MLRESSGSGGSPPPSLIPIFEPLPPRSESRIGTVGVGGGGGASPAPQMAAVIEFPGRHKWLGGAVDEFDGCIYGIPSHATETICLSPPHLPSPYSENGFIPDPDESEVSGEYQVRTIPLPPESVLPLCQANGGRFKWLRGVVCDGYLYGIPAWATAGVLGWTSPPYGAAAVAAERRARRRKRRGDRGERARVVRATR